MKNEKNIVEWIVAIIAIIGFLFGYFSIGTVLVTLICAIGLFVLVCKRLWKFETGLEENSKSKDFVNYMSRTKKVLTILFIVLPISFMFLNIVKKHFPEKATHFIAFHFSQPDELTEIKTEKIRESKFQAFTKSDTINCLKNVKLGSPKVAIKRKQNEHYFLSCSFIIDESIGYVSRFAYTLFYWLSGLVAVLIFGMLMVDKISMFFIPKKNE